MIVGFTYWKLLKIMKESNVWFSVANLRMLTNRLLNATNHENNTPFVGQIIPFIRKNQHPNGIYFCKQALIPIFAIE